MPHPPTPEQQVAIDLATTGDNLVIEALAGTGKTSTLEMCAGAMPRRQVQYVAFNKAIVTEAEGRFPSNVSCNTAHSLAFRTTGKQYAHRLRGNRMKSFEIARALRLTDFDCIVLGARKHLSAGFLGGIVLKACRNFEMTADPVPDHQHIPIIPGLDEPRPVDGKMVNQRGPNHREFCRFLLPYVRKAWHDIENVNGTLTFTHGSYLKLWQLSGPHIGADTVMYDEAQDANPCMLSIVAAQTHAQLIYVGDTYQQIYGWNGAINALETADPTAPRTHLTESFRFGPAIADAANLALTHLGCDYPLIGRGGPSTVGQIVGHPDAILFRTNAKAVAEALLRLADGQKVALVGGADDVVKFARDAEKLKAGTKVYHPDLACFDNWGEVQDYVEHDANGSDLRLLVDLIDEFGADRIIDGLAMCTEERWADVVLSTAHKAKGREWSSVVLAGDFPDPENRDISDEDVRLMYVAATRAKHSLDVTAVPFFKSKEPAE